MKMLIISLFFSFILVTNVQSQIPIKAELEETLWKDYLCTANKENYKYSKKDAVTFYLFKKNNEAQTWTVSKGKKNYIANGNWKIENGILIFYNMKYENSNYGEWIKEWKMKIIKIDSTKMKLWTTCRSEFPSWLFIVKTQ